MSGPENKPKIEQVSHEEIENTVMSALPSLDCPMLENLYDLIGLDLTDEKKGKKEFW